MTFPCDGMKDPVTWTNMDLRDEDGLPVTPPFVQEVFKAVSEIAHRAGWEANKVESCVHAEYPGYAQLFVVFRKEP